MKLWLIIVILAVIFLACMEPRGAEVAEYRDTANPIIVKAVWKDWNVIDVFVYDREYDANSIYLWYNGEREDSYDFPPMVTNPARYVMRLYEITQEVEYIDIQIGDKEGHTSDVVKLTRSD